MVTVTSSEPASWTPSSRAAALPAYHRPAVQQSRSFLGDWSSHSFTFSSSTLLSHLSWSLLHDPPSSPSKQSSNPAHRVQLLSPVSLPLLSPLLCSGGHCSVAVQLHSSPRLATSSAQVSAVPSPLLLVVRWCVVFVVSWASLMAQVVVLLVILMVKHVRGWFISWWLMQPCDFMVSAQVSFGFVRLGGIWFL